MNLELNSPDQYKAGKINLRNNSQSKQSDSSQINISLLKFVDFIPKNENSRHTFLRNLKYKTEDIRDYWIKLKSAIKKYHRGIITLDELKDLHNHVKSKEQENFRSVIEIYSNFVKDKNYVWFKPPTIIWKQNNVAIKIMPQLGLICDDQKTLVLLYIRKEALSRKKAVAMITLFKSAIQAENMKYKIWIYDVQANQHFNDQDFDSSMMPLLRRELLMFENIWNKI